MRPIRLLLVAVVGLMLLAPTALAAGPSAGDQQYTDPLGGSSGQSNGGSTPPSSPPTPSSSATPSSSNSTAPSTAAASSTSSPTAVAASSTSATAPTSSSTPSGALPRTGFNAWLGAALGVALLGAGLAVRRQVHRD